MYRKENVPELVKHSLDLYVNNRIPAGHFLTAVLENDLAGAFAYADRVNKYFMGDIVAYIYNELPIACWGSREKVANWLKGE